MERDLREVIGNQLILNSKYPPSPIPELTYFLMKTMLSSFQPAIEFDYLFLAIFESFY